MHTRNNNLQKIISVLIFLFALCCVGVIGLMITRTYDVAATRAETVNDAFATITHAEELQLVARVEQQLATIALIPDVADARQPACNAALASVFENQTVYTLFGVVDPLGIIVCSAIPFTSQYVGDRPYIRRAMETRKMAVGEFQVGRVTQKPGINFALPIYDSTGKLKHMLIAAVSLGNFDTIFRQMSESFGSIFGFVDKHGTILNWYPGNGSQIGKPIEDAAIATYVESDFIGTKIIRGPRGQKMLYAFRPVMIGDQHVGTVIVGMPQRIFFTQSMPDIELIVLASGALLILAMLVIWKINAMIRKCK